MFKAYLFSPADSLDTAGGTRAPREPPGRRTESGEGKPLPRVLSLAGGVKYQSGFSLHHGARVIVYYS